MNTELQGIYAALEKLGKSGASEDAKRTQALTAALNSISAALTDLVSVAESRVEQGDSTDVAAIVERAISSINVEAPEIRFEPTINVESPVVNMPELPLALTVQAGPNHNHVNVASPEVTVMPAPDWKRLKVDFDYRNGSIVSASITRE